MSKETIFNTIRSRFKTEVADSLSVQTQYDNAPFDRPDNSEWVRFTILPGETFQASMGSSTNKHRTAGVAVAQIFSPVDKGDRTAIQIADTVISAFRSTTVSGVVFKSPSLARVGRTGEDWQVNVSCPFYVDENV